MYQFKAMGSMKEFLSQVRLLGLTKNCCLSLPFIQARGLTKKVFVSPVKLQQNWIRLRGANLGLLSVQCALKSVSVKALAKDISAVKSTSEYLYLYDRFKDSPAMTQMNRITILHHLAKVAASGPKKNFFSLRKVINEEKEIFIILLNNIGNDLETCKARDIATIVWSLGKLREHDAWFVTECENEILRRDQTSFRAPAVCKILIGFASLDLKRSKFFRIVEQRILDGQLKMGKFENRGLAGVLWSFTKTGNESKELLEKFQEEILIRDMREFSSDQLAQFLWSFTQKGIIPCDKLFSITEKEILQRPPTDLSNHCIKMLLWSFARAGFEGKEGNSLFASLSPEIIRRGVHDFDADELSMLAWAFAKRCPEAPRVFDVIEKELFFRGIAEFGTQELSQLLWSFAVTGHTSSELFNESQEVLISRDLSLLKVKQFTELVWALGRSTLLSSDFLMKAVSDMLSNATVYSDEELCMILHGCVQVSMDTQEPLKQLEREVLDRNIPQNKPKLIPKLASGFSTCSYEAGSVFDEIEKALLTNDLSMYTEQELQGLCVAFSQMGRELSQVKQTLKEGGKAE